MPEPAVPPDASGVVAPAPAAAAAARAPAAPLDARAPAAPAAAAIDEPRPDADVAAAIERDDLRGAVRLLMKRYGTSVYRFCRQMLGNDALTDDVHQQVFVQVFRDLPRYEKRSSMRTWLFGIARHRCLDAIKVEGRRDRRFPLEEHPGTDDPSTESSAIERISQAEVTQALETCLSELAPAARTAVLLRFREGFRYEEMAGMAREKPGTLQARVARALPLLRKCLERRLRDGDAA